MKFLRTLIFILIAAFGMGSAALPALVLNPKEWIVFVKTYGNDKFSINFPVDPRILTSNIDDQKVLSIKAEEAGAEYTLQIAPKFDENAIFDSLEKLKSNASITVLEESFTQQEKRKVLSYFYKDEKISKFFKTHIIITDKNVYSFSTSYLEGVKENHKFFISSFYLEP